MTAESPIDEGPIVPGCDPAVAVEKMMDQHGGMLFSLGLRFCGNPDEAADLVQETLLQVFRDWPGFRGDSKPSTWLYRIAARTCQRMQRRKREPLMPDVDTFIDTATGRVVEVPAGDDALECAITRESLEQLEQAIADLPADYRMPLILKEIVGFSGAEIGHVLDIAEATVRVRVHRARLMLRERIELGLPDRSEDRPDYGQQLCQDLLDAKQEAIDRGVPLDLPKQLLSDRCKSFFDSLDFVNVLCGRVDITSLPEDVQARVREEMKSVDA